MIPASMHSVPGQVPGLESNCRCTHLGSGSTANQVGDGQGPNHGRRLELAGESLAVTPCEVDWILEPYKPLSRPKPIRSETISK